jgi:hypothetical protein
MSSPAKYAEGPDPLDMKGNYSSPVMEAMRIIRRDFAKPLSLTILSEKVGVCPTRLSNVFMRHIRRLRPAQQCRQALTRPTRMCQYLIRHDHRVRHG